jgi:multicomponent Na+:H+ antiporter subunit E
MTVRGWMRPWTLGWFVAFYVWEILASSAWVAWEVITPSHRMRSGVIAVPIESRTPYELTWLANLVTLTPGTLSIDVDPDAHVLFVHGLHVESPESFREDIRRLERRLLKVLR